MERRGSQWQERQAGAEIIGQLSVDSSQLSFRNFLIDSSYGTERLTRLENDN